jgi:transposase
MGRALSLDLRQRAVQAYKRGEGTQFEVASRFEVGVATLLRWLRRDEAGSLAFDDSYHHGPTRMIEVANMAALEDLLRLNSDATNTELAELMETRTGLAISASTISRAIGFLGWTRKKVPRRQRSRLPACPRFCAKWTAWQGTVEGATIDTHDLDHRVFPTGTKVFKEFRVGGELVEARLLWKQAEANWILTTYIWDDAGETATANTSLTGVFPDDGYEIPTDKDCGKCHHGGSDYVLGVEAVALALPSAEGETLTDLAADGRLSDPPADKTVSLPEDATGHAGAALGFLHANCGMACHSTRGLGDETQLVMRLGAGELWDETGHRRDLAVPDTDTWLATVGVAPTTALVAQQYPGALRITPGDHEMSVVWQLSNLRGTYQMPPLASHVVDEADNAELAAWIDGLPP